jgi:hypothetical protein
MTKPLTGLMNYRNRYYNSGWGASSSKILSGSESVEPDDEDEGKNPNLATTLASIAIDTAKLITGVPLDYPDPLLTPVATVPQSAKEEPLMDDEKEKPMVDQMTDVVADAAGELAKPP